MSAFFFSSRVLLRRLISFLLAFVFSVLRDSLFACLVVVSIACCVYIVALEWLLIGS